MCLAVLTLSGCGSGVKFHGRLLVDDKPLPVSQDELTYLMFVGAAQDGKKAYSDADLSPDGSFVVKGTDGHGIPAGKYVVTFSQSPSAYDVSQGKAKPGDKFNGLFAKDSTSPLNCTITSSTKEVTIDLGKKTVTAN